MTGWKPVCLVLFLTVPLALGGCQNPKHQENPGALPVQEPAAPQETKAIAPGEGEQGARVEFVTREHKMERVLFSGGYLRSLPEEKPETILRPAPAGALGMIFGKREINVATRDGVTGWYTVPARPGAPRGEKREALKITHDGYQNTYPQVTGGVTPQVQDRINQELGNYISVYRHITGPVESELQCRVTYNRNHLLSLVFQGKPVLYRNYPVTEVNNLASWTRLKNYAWVSPLMGGADSSLLLARKTDFQYAMVFDLNTGNRLTLDHFLGSSQQEAIQEKLGSLEAWARLQKDNFYIEPQGKLVALASVSQGEGGRVPLDLSDLVIREF